MIIKLSTSNEIVNDDTQPVFSITAWNFDFAAQKTHLEPVTQDLFSAGYVEIRKREREELPKEEMTVKQLVLRDPIVQEVVKVFMARITDVRLVRSA